MRSSLVVTTPSTDAKFANPRGVWFNTDQTRMNDRVHSTSAGWSFYARFGSWRFS